MRIGIDRTVLLGIVLFAALIIGIAGTSYINTQRLHENTKRVARSRDLIDAIHRVHLDTVQVQADLRVFLVTGFEPSIKTYEESAARLRNDAVRLENLTADDSIFDSSIVTVKKEIETGIAAYDATIQLRKKPDGQAAIVALSRERGMRSFVDTLLETLSGMEEIERRRLTKVEIVARDAFYNAIFYIIVSALLGLVTVGMFTATIARSVRYRMLDSARITEQKQLLSATLTSIGDAVIATNSEGHVTFMNPVAEMLTGWRESDAKGKALNEVFNIVNETTRVPVENPAFRALKDGAIVGLANHTILISKTGSEIPIDDSAAPIRSNGVVNGAVLVFRDISEKKKAESTLARLAAIVESSDDAIVWKRLDGTVEFWNSSAERMFGYTSNEVVGKSITTIVPPDRLSEEESILSRLRNGERIDHFETIRRTKNGDLIPISVTVSPIRDSSGKLIGASKIARDLTRLKQGEKALAEARRRTETALQAGEVGTYYWDIVKDRVSGDRNFVAIFGVLTDDVSTAPIGDFISAIHPADRERIESEIRQTLKQNIPFHSEYRVNGPHGERWVLARGVVDRDENDQPTGWAGVLVDITRQRHTEEQLRRSEERRRLALDAAGLGTWNIDVVSRILTADERFNFIFGGSVESFNFESAFSAIHPDDRDRVRKSIENAMQPNDPPPYSEEFRVIHPDGSLHWISAKGRAHFSMNDTGNQFISLDGTVHDITARVLADQERASLYAQVVSERRLLDAVFDALPVGMVVAEPNGRLVRMNRANEKLWGNPPPTNSFADYGLWKGRWPNGNLIEPEDWALSRILLNGETVTGDQVQIETFEGNLKRSIVISGAPVHDATGRLVAGVIALLDVTERDRAESQLRESEERFRSLFESMEEGFCVIEPVYNDDGIAVDYRYLLANQALERHTGLKNVVGKTALRVMPTHEKHWIESYARVAETGEPFHHTDHVADLGRWYEVSAFRVGLPGERKVGVLFSDVTSRRIAEEILRSSEKQLAEVFQHAPSFMGVLRGKEHKFERTNDRYLELVGGRKLVGRTVREILPEIEGQGYFEILDRVYQTGETYIGNDHKVKINRGGRLEERVIDFVYQPMRDTDGQISGVLVQGIDITERKKAEDALKEADRKKDDFIALLAHELRNPLAPIRNGLQVIRLSDDPAIRDRSQKMMDRQLTHMVRMIDDLLDVSRIGRHKMELRRARVTLAEILNSALETARPVIEESVHEVTVSIPNEPIYLHADLTRLSQVFSNLLTNSAKYTTRGGKISISATRMDQTVAIVVRDNGIGIPQESLPTIFDMFSQVDRSAERNSGGLGIGLALVKGLVEMHDGSVTAKSDGEGFGSEFTVVLPVTMDSNNAVSAVISENPAVARSQRRRVLVVDDNQDSAESLSMMLQLLGDDVRMAHDGLEAISQAKSFRPDVILMDVGMPRLNGLDTTRMIREEDWGKKITIIALTGWGQDADRERTREAGCDGHLVKPVEAAVLEKTLQELSRRNRS